jgi:hypothetical protein
MITRDRILGAISWWIGLVGLAGLMNLPPMHPAARRHCLLGLVGNAIFIWSGWRRPCGGSEGGWDFQRTSIQGERLGHLLVRVASRIFWDVNKEVEMPNKSFNTRIHPLFIVGFSDHGGGSCCCCLLGAGDSKTPSDCAESGGGVDVVG